MSESIETVRANLMRLLNIPDCADPLEFLLNINEEREVKDFLLGLLDNTKADHREVIESVFNKWKQRHVPAFVPPNANYSVHKKHDATFAAPSSADRKNRRNKKTGVQQANEESAESSDSNQKRRGKYVPLFGEGGARADNVHLPGRHECSCQATQHKLVNNCLKCGRIVCDQEGSGPCFFCGTLVCTNEEEEILCRNSKASRSLLSKLMSASNTPSHFNSDRKELPSRSLADVESIRKAVEHKDKLLEYDRTVARRTKVIDDQSDYFTSENRWLSETERDVLEKSKANLQLKRESEKNSVKFAIDFAGRCLVEEEVDLTNSKYEEELQRMCEESLRKLNLEKEAFDPGLERFPKPSYDPTGLDNVVVGKQKDPTERENKTMRLQGRELQEMSDEGWCLSMHQPYATLLVNGIKLHEGRSWYSPLRGRLWIASTAREVSREEIEMVKQSMRAFVTGDKPNFSENYPVGCLLGCVDLVDCVSQEQYRETYPEGESQSPYVFICKNPRELIVKLPIRGEHKIYKLDSRIHDAAKRTLKKC